MKSQAAEYSRLVSLKVLNFIIFEILIIFFVLFELSKGEKYFNYIHNLARDTLLHEGSRFF
jgi:hypothetical protein